MPGSVDVGRIRAILGEALDAAGTKREKQKCEGVSASGNVVNLKLPGLQCSSANCQCGSALRVTLAMILGFGIASFIFSVTVITLRFLL